MTERDVSVTAPSASLLARTSLARSLLFSRPRDGASVRVQLRPTSRHVGFASGAVRAIHVWAAQNLTDLRWILVGL